jgi:predicted AlkP superfamily pyrophosphatase or phosphodiesterase
VRLDSRRGLRFLPVLAAGGALLAAAPQESRSPDEGPLVVVSIDGLRPDYILEADRYGLRIPELRRLAAEGASARGVTGVLPTVTYPSHATLVTGVAPARHGILANHPFDPLGRNQDGWFWYAEDIRVPTLWDAARAAGLRTASVDWPVTVGAPIDWNLPQVWRADTDDDAKLLRALATPGLLSEAERALGPWPGGSRASPEQDRKKAAFNVWMLRTKRPRLHFAYFASLDEEQHASGARSERALRALEALDRHVGELRRAAGSYGRATIAVVSDHGSAPAALDLDLEAALHGEGLIDTDGRGRVTAWRAQAWRAGATAAIVLRDPRDDDARRRAGAVLARLQARRGGAVERVLTGEEAAARGGFPGAAFVVALRPRPASRPPTARDGGKPDEAGEHGYLPENHDMDAAFVIAGPGVPAGADLGRIDLRDVAPTLAGRLGLVLSAAEGRDRLVRVAARRLSGR